MFSFLAFLNPFSTEDEEDASYQLDYLDYEPKFSYITQDGSKLHSMRNNFTLNDDTWGHINGAITLSHAKIALKTSKNYATLKRIMNNKLNEFEMILHDVNEKKLTLYLSVTLKILANQIVTKEEIYEDKIIQFSFH